MLLCYTALSQAAQVYGAANPRYDSIYKPPSSLVDLGSALNVTGFRRQGNFKCSLHAAHRLQDANLATAEVQRISPDTAH
jgi:hypothetical protein